MPRSEVRVLEATGPRELVIWFYRVASALRLARGHPLREVRGYGTPRALITHRMAVRRYAAVKQKALAAHVSPMRGNGRMSRAFRLALAVPAPAFGLIFGVEWFTDPGAVPGGPVLTDILRIAG